MKTFEKFIKENKKYKATQVRKNTGEVIGNEDVVEEKLANWLAAGLIGGASLAGLPSIANSQTTPSSQYSTKFSNPLQPTKAKDNKMTTQTLAPNTKVNFEELKTFIIKHEGKRNRMYKDSLNIPTIGVGFNLTRNDARYMLNQVGADYDNVLNKGEQLTDEQIDILLKHDIEKAIINAINFVDNFHELPANVQKVLIDMSFNLGFNRLNKFQKFKAALENHNYQVAANEMMNSKWYNQVKNRGKELVNIIKNIG